MCYGGYFTLTKHAFCRLLDLATTDALITSTEKASDFPDTLNETLVVMAFSVYLGDTIITSPEVWEVGVYSVSKAPFTWREDDLSDRIILVLGLSERDIILAFSLHAKGCIWP